MRVAAPPDPVVGRGPGPVARALAVLVVGYRRFLSPLLGPRCRFQPTCSAYALDALRSRGAGVGLLLTLWRVLRCQPFGTSGYDPVPERGWRGGLSRRARTQCSASDVDEERPVPSTQDGPGHAPTGGARPCTR